MRCFLGHAGSYKRFIKDFSKIVRLLCRLVEKDGAFMFDEACLDAFIEIKKGLLQLPLRLHRIGTSPLKLCVMLMILLLGPSWGKLMRRFSEPFTMLAEPSMRRKKTIPPLKGHVSGSLFM